jgi:hypothetical protein
MRVKRNEKGSTFSFEFTLTGSVNSYHEDVNDSVENGRNETVDGAKRQNLDNLQTEKVQMANKLEDQLLENQQLKEKLELLQQLLNEEKAARKLLEQQKQRNPPPLPPQQVSQSQLS